MRPTHEFKTSGGHTIVLNDYITGAENWAIRQIYIDGLKKDETSTALEAEKKAFEIVIVSIDDITDNIAEAVLALPLAEYNEIAAEVTPIVEGKKKSENSSQRTSPTDGSLANSSS
jgi:hypothetical protein